MHSALRFLPQVVSKYRPIHLTLFLTSRCDARCGFCFTRARGEGSASEELTFDEHEAVSASMGSLLWLAFSGGEPYLRGDISRLAALYYRQNRPSIILLPTNALNTDIIAARTREILTSCPKSVIAVKLSLDGVGPRHDELRGVSGAFERVGRTYDALAPMLAEFGNFELGVNTVFCPDNQDEMQLIAGHVKDRMPLARTHTVSLMRGVQGADRLDYKKYLHAARMLEGSIRAGQRYSFSGARIKAAQDVLQRRAIHRTVTQGRAQMPCHAGRLNIVISELAEVYPCESFTPQMSMGNLRQHGGSVEAVLRSERAADVLGRIRQSGCYCTHECFMMTNILFSPAKYPALLYEAMRAI